MKFSKQGGIDQRLSGKIQRDRQRGGQDPSPTRPHSFDKDSERSMFEQRVRFLGSGKSTQGWAPCSERRGAQGGATPGNIPRQTWGGPRDKQKFHPSVQAKGQGTAKPSREEQTGRVPPRGQHKLPAKIRSIGQEKKSPREHQPQTPSEEVPAAEGRGAQGSNTHRRRKLPRSHRWTSLIGRDPEEQEVPLKDKLREPELSKRHPAPNPKEERRYRSLAEVAQPKNPGGGPRTTGGASETGKGSLQNPSRCQSLGPRETKEQGSTPTLGEGPLQETNPEKHSGTSAKIWTRAGAHDIDKGS